jgi:LysM repeat protein
VTAVRGSRLAALVLACALVACSAGAKRPSPATTYVGPAPTLATTTSTSPTRYAVARGDTLTGIARRFDVSVAAIAGANHLTKLDQLVPGQVLVIPKPPPVGLVIRPAQGVLGDAFTFSLTGAKPDEVVVFEVVRPDGGKFVGPAHVTQPDGTVSTSYSTVFGDALGLYKVLAAGNEGTVVHAEFQVLAPPSSTTG